MIPPHPSGIGWDSPARTTWGSRRRAHQPPSRPLVWGIDGSHHLEVR